jgi:hypothetical protein
VRAIAAVGVGSHRFGTRYHPADDDLFAAASDSQQIAALGGANEENLTGASLYVPSAASTDNPVESIEPPIVGAAPGPALETATGDVDRRSIRSGGGAIAPEAAFDWGPPPIEARRTASAGELAAPPSSRADVR